MDRLIKHLEELIEERPKPEEAQLAASPAAIPAPEQVARAEGQGSSETYQHPNQVSPEQERPHVASGVGDSPQTSAAASQHVETQTDLWIAAKDRKRIIVLYLCLWPVVGLIGTGAYNLVWSVRAYYGYASQRIPLAVVSLFVSLILAVGQTMILKGYIGSAKRWIGYTVLASVIDNLSILVFVPRPVFRLVIVSNLARAGLQWLLLRKHVKSAWLWIVAGVAAGTVYSMVAMGPAAAGLSGMVQSSLVLVLLSSSLIAGAEIVCLIRFRRK